MLPSRWSFEFLRRLSEMALWHALQQIELGPLHTHTHEPRAVTVKLWEPERKVYVQRPCQGVSKVMWWCGHGSSSVVWSHVWLGSRPNVVSMSFCSCGFSCMLKWNKLTVVSVRSAMVSWFCVRPTFQEVVFGNNPTDYETWAIWCHVGIYVEFNYIHLAVTCCVSSLEGSVKRTWTGSAFSTNESAWSVMVTGSQFSCVKWPWRFVTIAF